MDASKWCIKHYFQTFKVILSFSEPTKMPRATSTAATVATAAGIAAAAAAVAVTAKSARRYLATVSAVRGRLQQAQEATVVRRRPANVGDPIQAIETPCLVVDLNAVRASSLQIKAAQRSNGRTVVTRRWRRTSWRCRNRFSNSRMWRSDRTPRLTRPRPLDSSSSVCLRYDSSSEIRSSACVASLTAVWQ